MTTKIIVRKKAEISDLIVGKTYLIGLDGGRSSAVYEGTRNGKHYFKYKGDTFSASSLDSIYVI